MDRKSHAAPVQQDERGYTPRLIQGFGWLLVLGLAATSAALWWAPPLTFSSNVVEGRVLNPATVELPFGPNVSFAVLRVQVFPRGKPVQLWNESLPMTELLLETEKGTVQLALPPWEGWRHHPGVLWSSGPVWKTYETLEGLPVLSEIPGWREATTSRGFKVSYKRLLQGDHVVVEDPETKNARLWRGSLASVQAGHRLATRVAGGMLLLFSVGIGRATVLLSRGRWSLHQ